MALVTEEQSPFRSNRNGERKFAGLRRRPGGFSPEPSTSIALTNLKPTRKTVEFAVPKPATLIDELVSLIEHPAATAQTVSRVWRWLRPHRRQEEATGFLSEADEALHYFPLDIDEPIIIQHRTDYGPKVTVHRPGCLCIDLEHSSCTRPRVPMTEMDHKLTEALLRFVIGVGNNLRREFFSGSPQEHAILNRHLLDYFKSRQRSLESTPYNIPNSQLHLLQDLGMEQPQPDAPEVPHGLHKSIEESQLRRMRNYLTPDNYGIISVKASKLHLLPPTTDIQNPVYEAKDVSRYPGIGIKTATLGSQPTYFMHDVSSEVTPHELVERLDAENPTGHLFVTGINPVEVLDRVQSFEPSSHVIDYDLGSFDFIFTGSASAAYSTPIDVTTAWLRTSSVRASTGRVYHVVLLDYKLGHCLWHVFSGDAAEQHTRTFGTGSYVRLPAVCTGTWREEWVQSKALSSILAFTARTPDLSTRNLAAKVAQLATSVMPRMTSREQRVATNIAHRMAPVKTWDYVLSRAFWSTLYFLSFQWQLLSPFPDVYNYLNEHHRYRVIHPTQGGGWSPRVAPVWKPESIPNVPSWLQRVSALTSSIFTFLIPKIVVGEVVSSVFMHVDLFSMLRNIVYWMDVQPLRVALTASIVIVTAILPGHIVKVFSRLAGHFWRQLWLPGWINGFVKRVITEICGGPGARFLVFLPGRGWAYQAYVWAVGLLSVFPKLVPWFILPHALLTGWWWVFTIIAAVVILENAVALLVVKPLVVGPRRCASWFSLAEWWRPSGGPSASFGVALRGSLAQLRLDAPRWTKMAINWVVSYLGPAEEDLRCLPSFTNLPPRPVAVETVATSRKVDIPLPMVTVRPAKIPTSSVAPDMAVDPTGLSYGEWLKQVETAYQAAPTKFPSLTPGNFCFWECVATYGGTPHMWYSWFMSVTDRLPDPSDPVVGHVRQSDMIRFATESGFGIVLTGLCSDVVQPVRSNWPTLSLTMSHSSVDGLSHVEITRPKAAAEPQAKLARILATVRAYYPAWAFAFQNQLNASPLDSSVTPTAALLSMVEGCDMSMTRNDVVEALLGSFQALPIDKVNQGPYAFSFNVKAPWPTLVEYNQPNGDRAIGWTSPSVMWKRFRVPGLRKGLRLTVDPAQHGPVDPDTKIGATPEQARDNMRAVARPNPSHWDSIRRDLAVRLKDYVDLELPAVPLQEELVYYTADLGRAARLVADLKAHPSVLEAFQNASILQSLDNVLDLHKLEGKTVRVPVRMYFGVWGCGKTTATASYLRGLDPDVRRQARVVSHTESLRAQAKAGLDFPEMRGFNFPTLASVIMEPATGPIILDDAGKFWGGMLDLLILANPMLTEVVVNGDPAQGFAKFPVAGTQSEYDDGPLACLAPLVTKYATVSHRAFALLADTFGVHTTSTVEGHITHTNEPKVGLPVCTASPRYAGVLAAGGRRAYTYASVQGEDFDEDMEVDMTGLEGSVLDRSAYVAMTRSKTGVFVHMDAMDPESRVRQNPTGSMLMNALVCAVRAGGGATLKAPDAYVKAAFYRHLHWCMPSLVWFSRIGASIPAGEFQSVFPAVNPWRLEQGTASESAPAEHSLQVAPPVDTFVPEVHFHAKENRELQGRGGATNQFKEVAFVNPHDHKRGDTATYFLSVEKRLQTRGAKENLRRMMSCPRTDLCDEYDKLVPNPPQWTAAKHEQYCERAIDEYTSKRSAEAVRSKLAAHDPDRTGSDIVISLKNQVIKKDEKRDKVEAIPGQLIHEYDITQTLNDAPFALFLEDEIISAFPDNFLFYRRMNPDEFIAAYQKRWRVGNGVHTSDVTRWDVGCDAGVLNFDVHVMRRSGYPEDYIDAYVLRRLSSRSQHGPMGTMQNSGDRYTWPLNSVRRAVVASLINDVTSDDTVAINGDDEAIDRHCTSKHFPDSPWIFKNLNGQTGEFSGFELGGATPEYSARGILYRTMILESRDPSAQNKWLNYLGLLAHANHETPQAAAVAMSAYSHMKTDLFAAALPKPLRGLFPYVTFPN